MEPIIAFLIDHWILSAIFTILAVGLLINEWRARTFGMKSVSPQELVNMLNHSNAVLIDIRNEERFSKGHILGAQNIVEKEIPNRFGVLNKFKSRPVILICTGGLDAPKLYSLLTKEGFTQLYYLAGGMTGWQSNGLPVVKK